MGTDRETEGTDLRTILEGFPGVRRITATKADVRRTLLESGGTMTLRGEMWDIKAKYEAAGIYKVWLELHQYGAKREVE